MVRGRESRRINVILRHINDPASAGGGTNRSGRAFRASLLGVGGYPEQAVDQGGLRAAGLLQEFGDVPIVEAAMPGSLPFVAYQQTSGFGIEDERPPTSSAGRGPRGLR
jgi:hypothetical protein